MVTVDGSKTPSWPLILDTRSLISMRNQLVDAVTRIIAVREVLSIARDDQIREGYARLIERHLDSMENVNMDRDPFFQVRRVLDLGTVCYQQLLDNKTTRITVENSDSLVALEGTLCGDPLCLHSFD